MSGTLLEVKDFSLTLDQSMKESFSRFSAPMDRGKLFS
jgi:hypothetical protein